MNKLASGIRLKRRLLCDCHLVVVVCLAMFPVILSNAAHATKCWRPPPSEHIQRSEIVFFGEVISVRMSGRSPRHRISTMKVLRDYKGADVPLIRIRYLEDWNRGIARRGWKFNIGDKLLVFAERLGSAQINAAADAKISLCSMLPYHGRKELHPIYWERLSEIRSGLN